MLAPRVRLCTAWWFCDCCAVFMPCLIILFCSADLAFVNICVFAIFSVSSVGADNIRPLLLANSFFCCRDCFIPLRRGGLCSARFSACERLYFCYILCSLVGADNIRPLLLANSFFFVVAIVLFHSVGVGLCSTRFNACECLLFYAAFFVYYTRFSICKRLRFCYILCSLCRGG